MSKRIFIITRPEEDAKALAAAVRAAGGVVIAAPLLRIRFREGVAIPPLSYQAVAITSANGARALASHGDRGRITAVPAVVVGPASEKAAREAGFTRIIRASRGDVTGVIATLREFVRPGGGPVLYLSGAVTRGDLQAALAADGITVERVVMYEAVAAEELPPAVAAHLRGGRDGCVMLYSPRTAKIWVKLVRDAGLMTAAARLDHACLSENVRRALLAGMDVRGRIIVPERPDEGAMRTALGLSD